MVKNSFIKLYNFFFNYPTPSNLTNVWNFGVLAFIFLMLQIVSGLLLSLYYVPTAEWAFYYVEYITRDTYFGWYIRYLHANGASFFFFVVYMHFFRSLYYFSYLQPKLATWNTGVLVLALMIVTAFTGYVLPWGQMSFWAATVITNLITVFPVLGDPAVKVVWGSFSVTTYTLNRFYTAHFILPFVILFIIVLHFIFLHKVGSSNNLRIQNKGDKLPFHPYYTVKDILNVALFMLLYYAIIRFAPNVLGHSDNYIEADPMSTPAHIIPEWYFLAFYAMLRSIPSKGAGVSVLISSILILFIFPYFFKWSYTSNIWSANRFDLTNPKSIAEYCTITQKTCPLLQKYLFWLFVINFIGLSYIGMMPVEDPYLFFGLIMTFYYFMYFCSMTYIMSFHSWLELMKEYEKEFEIIYYYKKLAAFFHKRITKPIFDFICFRYNLFIKYFKSRFILFLAWLEKPSNENRDIFAFRTKLTINTFIYYAIKFNSAKNSYKFKAKLYFNEIAIKFKSFLSKKVDLKKIINWFVNK